MSENKAVDILGVKGISDSIKIGTQAVVDGANAFLSRVCLPVAEEIGLALRDRVSAWRQRNLISTLSKANDLHVSQGCPQGEVNPRLIHIAIEEASWIEDKELQRMWAGLLASAVSDEGGDDNLLFMNLLKQLSALQVRLLNYAVENSKKLCSRLGFVSCDELIVPLEELSVIAGITDFQRLDRELDHLRELGLIGNALEGGIGAETGATELSASPLALHLYVRAQGSRQSPAEFWKLPPTDLPRNGN